jgi:predicted DNA-binding protein
MLGMGQQSIVLDLPDNLYERIQQIADQSDRSLETLLLESLDLLFGNTPDTNLSVSTLDALSDVQLWAVVYRRLLWPQSSRLHHLSERHPRTTQEQDELDQLLNRVDQDILLRSEALRLLKERGHSVDRFFATEA